jgi:hypothetical protein
MKSSEVLSDALDILNKQGWCRNVYHTGQTMLDGQHCSAGAISAAWLRAKLDNRIISDKTRPEAYLYRVVMEEGSLSVENWNDQAGRSFSDVQLVFKKAIHLAEEEND